MQLEIQRASMLLCSQYRERERVDRMIQSYGLAVEQSNLIDTSQFQTKISRVRCKDMTRMMQLMKPRVSYTANSRIYR